MTKRYDEERIPNRELVPGDLFHPPLCWGTVLEVVEVTAIPVRRDDQVGLMRAVQVRPVEGFWGLPVLQLDLDEPVTRLHPRSEHGISGSSYLRKLKEQADGKA